MPTIGQGAREIRVQDGAGAFRVVYGAKFAGAGYVLHCVQKKTRRTAKADLELVQKRYREAMKEATP